MQRSAIDNTLMDRIGRVKAAFEKAFGGPATVIAQAPGRVNLIGEHTDYNDGFVLPMAIERSCLALLRPRKDRQAHVRSTGVPGEAVFDVDISPDAPKTTPITLGEPDWSRYIRGVVAFSYTPNGFDLLLDCDVPAGGGLSSSAAIELATATALEAHGGVTFDPVVKALLCQMAEHRYGGTPCGIMDQYISSMGKAGHALLIDCRSRACETVPMADPDIEVLIINSNVKHELTGGEYAERRAQCEKAAEALGVAALRDATMEQLESAKGTLDDAVYRRARHVIGEDVRTLATVDALKRGDWTVVGKHMYASHDSLRDDFEVSTLELDYLVELASKLGEAGGVIGSWMTGGGFGGCTVTLVRVAQAKQIADAVCKAYKEKTGITAEAFLSRPADGATLLDG